MDDRVDRHSCPPHPAADTPEPRMAGIGRSGSGRTRLWSYEVLIAACSVNEDQLRPGWNGWHVEMSGCLPERRCAAFAQRVAGLYPGQNLPRSPIPIELMVSAPAGTHPVPARHLLAREPHAAKYRRPEQHGDC